MLFTRDNKGEDYEVKEEGERTLGSKCKMQIVTRKHTVEVKNGKIRYQNLMGRKRRDALGTCRWHNRSTEKVISQLRSVKEGRYPSRRSLEGRKENKIKS